jgi:hypothetical protein
MSKQKIAADVPAKKRVSIRKARIAKTTKVLKDVLTKSPETKKVGRISKASKDYFDYQTSISSDINYALKNIKFIPSSTPLEILEDLNREIIPSHGTKLSKSLKYMGNIRPIIITKIKFKSRVYKYYLLDGQHLYTALKSLGVDEIPVVELPIESIESLVKTIAMLNSSSKSWTLKDYVIAWSNIKPDYTTLLGLYSEFDMELSIVAAICTNSSLANATPGTSVIKSGEFQIHDLDKSREKLSDINELLNLLPRMDRAANRFFILSLINLFEEVSYTRKHHKKLLKFVENNRETLRFTIVNVNELKNYLLQAFN